MAGLPMKPIRKLAIVVNEDKPGALAVLQEPTREVDGSNFHLIRTCTNTR